MTEGDFSEKLGQILSDPARLAQIAELAKGFAGSESAPSPAPPPPQDAPPPQEASPAANPLSLLPPGFLREWKVRSRERMDLLRAVRPFLEPERREKVDRVLSILKTLDLLALMQP